MICRKSLVDAVGEQEAAKLYPRDSAIQQDPAAPELSSPADATPTIAASEPCLENGLDPSAVQSRVDGPQPAPASSSPLASSPSGEAYAEVNATLIAASGLQESSTAVEHERSDPAGSQEQQLEEAEEDGEVLSEDEDKPVDSASQPIQLRLAQQISTKPEPAAGDSQEAPAEAPEPKIVAVELIAAAKPSHTGVATSVDA